MADYEYDENGKCVGLHITAEDIDSVSDDDVKEYVKEKLAEWHQFTVDGNRFITDGYAVYSKRSYDRFVAAFEEKEGVKFSESFTKWAALYAGDSRCIYNVLDHEHYDADYNICIFDFGYLSDTPFYEEVIAYEKKCENEGKDEYEDIIETLAKKVVNKVLEIRKKVCGTID